MVPRLFYFHNLEDVMATEEVMVNHTISESAPSCSQPERLKVMVHGIKLMQLKSSSSRSNCISQEEGTSKHVNYDQDDCDGHVSTLPSHALS